MGDWRALKLIGGVFTFDVVLLVAYPGVLKEGCTFSYLYNSKSEEQKKKEIKVLVPFSREYNLFLYIFFDRFLVKSKNNKIASRLFFSWDLMTLMNEMTILF